MSSHKFKQVDFDRPSLLFRLEDRLTWVMGGPLIYAPHFRSYGLRGSERVLDFGCGGGAGSRVLARLLSQGGHLTCVDASGYWIDKAARRLGHYPNVECLQGDIRELPLRERSFDAVSIIHVIHDIAPEERQAIAHRLAQLLDANGTIFIREPVKKSHGMPVEEIRALFDNAGLVEGDHKVTGSEYTGRFHHPS
ncbi:MAG: class I SAM-dependent methyltransferase [Chloroflexota bacterium]